MLRRAILMVLMALFALSLGAGGLSDLMATLREDDTPSRVSGTDSRGRLMHGKHLPSRGENFHVYSGWGALMGRTHVHHAVRDATLEAYASLATSHPSHRFVYAETGWPSGGPFAPHHTHQRGLSVDFVIPVLDSEQGAPATLGCWPWNSWCYGLEFDARGQGKNTPHRVDFEAMSAHLAALDAASRAHGLRIRRVIVTPDFHDALRHTASWKTIAALEFMKREAWVRHDDHYHVDFALAP